LHIVENKENAGFGRANNQAVKRARGEYILLLNSDIVVLDNAIDELLSFYKGNEKTVQFVGGKLLNKDGTAQPSAAPHYSLPIVFAKLFLRGNHWGVSRSSPNTTKRVGWVSGACILTKK